jgi:putative PIN family toxin of toxin-antitoxin system
LRAALDPNVIISGLLSRTGAPAQVLRAFDRGDFEVVISEALLRELTRALTYPKLRRYIDKGEATAVRRWLSESAVSGSDPAAPHSVRSPDPGDDYLIALASSQRAALVSGDRHLLDLADEIPVFSPRDFLRLLETSRE